MSERLRLAWRALRGDPHIADRRDVAADIGADLIRRFNDGPASARTRTLWDTGWYVIEHHGDGTLRLPGGGTVYDR